MTSAKWTENLPDSIGWYWQYDKYDKEINAVYVRDYAGNLAIHNSALKSWPKDRFLWMKLKTPELPE
jgi:hypothetical protein